MGTAATVDGDREVNENAGIIGRSVAVVRFVNRWLHLLAGLILVLVMLVTMIDVVGRSFFDSPFRGTIELTEMAMVVIVYLGLGYAAHEGDHISVDLIDAQVGPRMRLALAVFTGIFGAGVIGMLTWNLYRFADRLDLGGYTTGVLKLSQGPVALIAVLGGAMFVLALISTAALALRALLRRAE